MFKKSYLPIWISAGVVVAVAAFLALDNGDGIAEADEVAARVVRKAKKADATTAEAVRGKKRRAGKDVSEERIEAARSGAKAVKPADLLHDEELTSLSKEQREMIVALQEALDDNRYGKVKDVVDRIMSGGDVPKVMRERCIDALAWFGKKSMKQLMGIAKSDPDNGVRGKASEQLLNVVDDPAVSDRERSALVKELAIEPIEDKETIENLLSKIDDMRHSVAIETITYIMEKGSPSIKERIPETLESFTGEENVKTASDARTWLRANPDEPEDEETYGGMKESRDD